jgi:type I restriction enzyme M protein
MSAGEECRRYEEGPGQYFTPRWLIRAMVECVCAEPMRIIANPAYGTGSFILAGYDYIVEYHEESDSEQKKFLKQTTFYGNDIDAGTRTLALILPLYPYVFNNEDQSPHCFGYVKPS